MKILFISDNFFPETNAPATRTYEHTKKWVELGHEVVVITCFPNFPKGKIFPGYTNKLIGIEHLNGIKIIRVWSYMTENNGVLLRTLDFISFMLSSFFAALFISRPNVVVITSPQFFVAITGVMISSIKRCPFIFELRDIWPASLKAVGIKINKRLFTILEKTELFMYERANLIVSVTESFSKNLESRGINKDKIKVVRNGVTPPKVKFNKRKLNDLRKKLKIENKFVVSYIGTHGLAHNLHFILECIEQLKIEPSIHFIFIGDGAVFSSLLEEKRKKSLNNLTFIGSVQKEELRYFYELTNLSLISLNNSPIFSEVIPSKIFECLGFEKPMILSAPKGEASQLVTDYSCGFHVTPVNPTELSRKITFLKNNPEILSKMKANSSSAIKENTVEVRAKEMLRLMEETVG